MSIKQTEFTKFIEEASKKFSIEKSSLIDLAASVGMISQFTSKKAKDYAEEKDININDVAHRTNGKVSMNDLKLHMGVKISKSDLFTAAARKLAYENNLTELDFPEDKRTGSPRKSGEIQISMADVKLMLGLVSSPKKTDLSISPRASEIAKENDIDLSKIKGSGKENRILLSDIKEYIEKKSEDDKDSSSDNDSDNDSDNE